MEEVVARYAALKSAIQILEKEQAQTYSNFPEEQAQISQAFQLVLSEMIEEAAHLEYELFGDDYETEIFMVSAADMSEAWSQVVDIDNMVAGLMADTGMGDAQIALLMFNDNSWEVGVGACLRPYNLLYQGMDAGCAFSAWAEKVATYIS